MIVSETIISSRICHVVATSGKPQAVLVKPLGEFERMRLVDECGMVAEKSGKEFVEIAFEVTEKDLLPEGAQATLDFLKNGLMPYVSENWKDLPLILGGYSLGGLFALWASTVLDGINAVFAGSPSLWMDGWDEYSKTHPTKARFVYMSLGDKEECTRKQPFCKVGDRVRAQHELNVSLLGEENCTLVWNEGGHFKDTEERKANGFAWCLERISRL